MVNSTNTADRRRVFALVTALLLILGTFIAPIAHTRAEESPEPTESAAVESTEATPEADDPEADDPETDEAKADEQSQVVVADASSESRSASDDEGSESEDGPRTTETNADVPVRDPVENPTIPDACGIDTTLTLDASDSIEGAGAVDDVRNAAKAFLDDLADTDSKARLTQFGTMSENLIPSTLVTSASLAPGGSFANALDGYYSPQPPVGVTAHQYDGSGDPALASSWLLRKNSGFTNWDQSLARAGDEAADLLVYVTDGRPSAYDFEGDPFSAPDVGWQTQTGLAEAVTLDKAIDEANRVKSATNGKTRILVVGVGNAFGDAANQDRLKAISGPVLKKDGELDSISSINDLDVAVVTDFDKLAAFMREIVLELCSPSVTVQKLAETVTDNGTEYLPAEDWDITLTPQVDSTATPPFEWILPDTTAAASKTLATNDNGNAQFQWEPNPSDKTSRALISEKIVPGYTPGRPGADNDWTCDLKDENGEVRTVMGELTVDDGNAQFVVTPIGSPPIAQEIVTCKLYNSLTTGKIIVKKETDPDGSMQKFEFAPSWGDKFSLADGESKDSEPLLPADDYSVSETVPAGWDLTSAVCSDGSSVTAIDLGPGETVTCTFTNTQAPTPTVPPTEPPAPTVPPTEPPAPTVPPTEPSTTPAVTGSQWMGPVLAAGSLLLALGVALLIAARRRQSVS